MVLLLDRILSLVTPLLLLRMVMTVPTCTMALGVPPPRTAAAAAFSSTTTTPSTTTTTTTSTATTCTALTAAATSIETTNTTVLGFDAVPVAPSDPPLSKKQLQRLSQQLPLNKVKYKIYKQMRKTAQEYQMFEDGDKIMVCVSGGKDSAVLLVLLLQLQQQLKDQGIVKTFDLVAVHVDQKQPGYDGQPLVDWLDELQVPYKILEEDTYSIVVEKTSPDKSFCTMCSRLRRGILYTTALELGCNKLVLGHHADDSIETLLLNMIHNGQMKAMPPRYTSQRGKLAVMRPLLKCLEDDIALYAQFAKFPILPCNLCKNQPNLHRPQVKLLLQTMESAFTKDTKKNMLNAMSDIKPSHLLDQQLRRAVGMDPITGEDEMDAHLEV